MRFLLLSVLFAGAASAGPFGSGFSSGGSSSGVTVVASLTSCSSANRGTQQLVSGTGRLYVCDGTAFRRVFTSADGVLPGADVDVPSHSFVAQNEQGGYLLRGINNGCVDFGSGTADEICATANNELTVSSTIKLQTTYIAQPACHDNQTCRWITSAGYFFGLFPTDDATGCESGTKGGLRMGSTDGRLKVCNGTALQKVAVEDTGGLQLPTYATASLPAASPAGRLVYDTDAACVKFTDGSTWACL